MSYLTDSASEYTQLKKQIDGHTGYRCQHHKPNGPQQQPAIIIFCPIDRLHRGAAHIAVCRRLLGLGRRLHKTVVGAALPPAGPADSAPQSILSGLKGPPGKPMGLVDQAGIPPQAAGGPAAALWAAACT